MDDKHIVAFDTSALNKLADDPDYATLLAKICTGFHVRLSTTSAWELIATPDAPRRRELLVLCQQLMRSGDCIHDAYHLLQRLISNFEGSQDFDWQQEDVRFREAEDALRSGEDFNNSESERASNENREANRKFEEFYRKFRTSYADVFQGDAARPADLRESVERLRKSGAFAKMASALYVHLRKSGVDPHITSIQRFTGRCPPFRLYLLGLCAARYTRNLRDPKCCSLKAGALDTSMAVCLLYCNVFVTDDGRMQKCFKEIVAISGLGVEVLSYNSFRQRAILEPTQEICHPRC